MIIMLLLLLLIAGNILAAVGDVFSSCIDCVEGYLSCSVSDIAEKDLQIAATDMKITVGELTYVITMDDVKLDA